MAWTVSSSGTSSQAVGTTEQSLANPTTAATYQLLLDLANMAGGATPDILEVRIYTKVRSSDAEGVEDYHTFVGSQLPRIWRSKPYPSPHYVRFGITQTQGTARAIIWAVYTS